MSTIILSLQTICRTAFFVSDDRKGLFHNNLAHGAGSGTSGVGFIGVDVHRQRKAGFHPHHHIAEGQRATVGLDAHIHFLFVLPVMILAIFIIGLVG